MNWRVWISAAAAAAALAIGSPAGVLADPARDLETAREAVLAGDHSRAINLLTRVLAEPDVPAEVRAYLHMARAGSFAAKGEDVSALNDLDAAIEAKPDLAEAHGGRGEVLVRLGRIDEGIAAFDTAIKLDPQQAMAYGHRGFARYAKGDYKEALRDVNVYVAREPAEAGGYAMRAMIFRALGEPDKALSDLNQALALDPAKAGALAERAQLNFDQLRFEQAFSDADATLKIDPDNLDGLLVRGMVHSDRGEHAKALADLDRLVEVTEGKDASALGYRALARMAAGEEGPAEADLQAILRLDPRSGFALRNLADIRLEENRLAEAERLATDAIAVDAKDVAALHTRSTARLYQGRFEAAMQDAEQAIRAAPASPFGYMARVAVNYHSGRFAAALPDHDRVIEMSPDEAIERHFRGMTYLNLGRWREAEADFVDAQRLDPSFGYSALALRYVRGRLGHPDPAAFAAQAKAAEADAWPRPILDHFVKAGPEADLLKAASAAEAKEDADQVCEAHFYLGQEAVLRGDPAAARSHLEQAVAQCRIGFFELPAAKAELQRLGAGG